MSKMEDDLSSDDDYDHVRMPGITIFSKDKEDLHRAMSKMKEVPFGDEEGDFLSPIGSPAADSFTMGNRGKFHELKRKLEEDQANRSKNTVAGEDIDSINSVDVDGFLDIFHAETEVNDQSRMSSLTMRLDNHPKFTEMYRQIKERDHKILDLEARVNELDRHAVDMQDTISQRDKLINSKNEAISMVNNKHRKELEFKEEELRKTQQTMFDLEKNLSGIHERFNQEKNQLTSDLESQRKKIEVLQANTDSLESKSEALQTKAEVLQEEVSRLRTEKEEILVSISEKDAVLLSKDSDLLSKDADLLAKDTRIAELTETTSKLELTLKKLKLQFQAKLKAFKEKQADMEEAIKGVEKVGELENKIADLINQVAVLEEEKGSFLLQKMEYEENLQSTITELTNEVNNLNTIKQSSVEEIQQLKDLLTEAQDKTRKSVQEIADISSEKNAESERALKLDSEIFDLRSKLADMEMSQQFAELAAESLEVQMNELDSLKKQLNDAKTEKEISENQLLLLTSELENVRVEYDSLKKEVLDVQQGKQSAEIQLESLEVQMNELDSLKKQLNDAKTEKEISENQLLLLTSELENVRVEYDSLKKEVLDVQQGKQSAEIQLESLEVQMNELDSLKKQLNDAKTEKEISENQLLLLTSELENVRVEYDSLKKEVLDVQQGKQSAEIQLESLEVQMNELDSLKKQLNDAKTEKEISENQLLLLTSELENVRVEYDSLKKEVLDVQQGKQSAEIQLESLEVQMNELDSLKKRLNDAKTEKEISENQLLLLTSELENLRVEYDSLKKEVLDVQQGKQSAETQLESLEVQMNDFESLKKERNEIKAEKETSETERQKLTIELENSRLEYDSQKQEILDIQMAKEKAEIQLQTVIGQFESLNLEHNSMMLDIQNAKDSAESQLGTLTAQFESLGWEHNSLKQDYSQIQSEKHWCEEELKSRIAELESLKMANEALKGEIGLTKEANELFHNQLQERINELERITLEKDTLGQEIVQTKNEIRVLESKLQERQDELESLKWEHEENIDTCKQLSNEIQKLNTEKATFHEIEIEHEKKIAENEAIVKEATDAYSQLAGANESLQAQLIQLETEKKLVESQSQFELNFLKTELQTYRDNYEVVAQENERLVIEITATKNVSASVDTAKTAAVATFVDWSEKQDQPDVKTQEDSGDDGWSNFGWGDPEIVEDPVTTEKPFLTTERETVDAHLQEKRQLELRIETLLEEYRTLDSKADGLEEDIWRIQKERDELSKALLERDSVLQEKEAKVEELNASVATLESTLKRLKLQFQSKLKALKEKQTDSTSEERKTHEERGLDSPSPVRTDDDSSISILKDEVAQLRQEKLAISIKLNACEGNLAECKNDLEVMRWDYQGLQENCEVLNQEIRRLKSNEEKPGNKEVTATGVLEDKVQQLAVSEAKILELESILESREARVLALEAEAEKLRKYEAELNILRNEYVDYKSTTEPLVVSYKARIDGLVAELALAAIRIQIPPSAVPTISEESLNLVEQDNKIVELKRVLEEEQRGRRVYERKIELLQGKISEIEQSEMKCFEETLLLKSWTRELEIDNQKKQSELDLIRNSGDGDLRNIKATILQQEVMRLVNELQDRDSRCEGLTSEITRLLEERDSLQLKLSNLQTNLSTQIEPTKLKEIPDDIPSYDREMLQLKLGELEEINYVINMDLRREREARRLVQEQLFFSQSTRGYGQPRNKSPVPSPTRTSSRPPAPNPVAISSPAILAPTPSPFIPTISSPSPSFHNFDEMLPSDHFQTVELDNNGANSKVAQSPPSPVMRI